MYMYDYECMYTLSCATVCEKVLVIGQNLHKRCSKVAVFQKIEFIK